ncbi:hypothetical protein Bca52824_072945 [Brassica carinata]|uniref:Uncharacterized protein n=1 Tax=Brassica carinata TaxID=52824 RepID=A0A8X7U7F3_BRACI|nr:hypothetical protein Bca52824_072945 [Brassica carinata]
MDGWLCLRRALHLEVLGDLTPRLTGVESGSVERDLLRLGFADGVAPSYRLSGTGGRQLSHFLTRVPVIAGQSDTWWRCEVSFPNGSRLWADGP